MFHENLRLVFEYVLVIVYILLFFLQIVLLIRFIKRKNKWIYPAGASFISCIAAIILMFFYNSLPGYGPMPGLTYFAEFCYSFIASIAFAGMLILSILCRIILTFITRIKQHSHS